MGEYGDVHSQEYLVKHWRWQYGLVPMDDLQKLLAETSDDPMSYGACYCIRYQQIVASNSMGIDDEDEKYIERLLPRSDAPMDTLELDRGTNADRRDKRECDRI